MKTVDGVKYLTIGEVSKLIDRSAQTIKNWYKWAKLNNEEGSLPPFRRDLDLKGTYYFAEDDVPKLIQFRDSISYGQMSDFNVSRWGQRGKEIEARKQESDSVSTLDIEPEPQPNI
jgi:hypothetical protein